MRLIDIINRPQGPFKPSIALGPAKTEAAFEAAEAYRRAQAGDDWYVLPKPALSPSQGSQRSGHRGDGNGFVDYGIAENDGGITPQISHGWLSDAAATAVELTDMSPVTAVCPCAASMAQTREAESTFQVEHLPVIKYGNSH